MLDDEYNKKFHKYETFYDKNVNGLSPADMAQKHIDEFFVKLSEPLKKMQAEFLTNVTKNCYKEKHLSDSFTNYEQIMICKETEREKIWANFDKMYINHRDSGMLSCFLILI